jgi:hypothetical protein
MVFVGVAQTRETKPAGNRQGGFRHSSWSGRFAVGILAKRGANGG